MSWAGTDARWKQGAKDLLSVKASGRIGRNRKAYVGHPRDRCAD